MLARSVSVSAKDDLFFIFANSESQYDGLITLFFDLTRSA